MTIFNERLKRIEEALKPEGALFPQLVVCPENKSSSEIIKELVDKYGQPEKRQKILIIK